jgi:hypothetical protein
MGGLIFLAVLGSWIAASYYLTDRIPKWLKFKPFPWMGKPLIFLLVFCAPFTQEIVGLWQFDRLCRAKDIVFVSPDADKVKRARSPSLPTVDLTGYWIPIRSQPIAYVDIDTGKPFLTYEALHTGFGVIGRITALGNSKSCWPKKFIEISNQINTQEKLDQGKK